MRLRPEQQGYKDYGHGEEGKSSDENCHCSDPLQPPSPSEDPPVTAAIRLLLLESPLELSGVHVVPPTRHRAPLPVGIVSLDRGLALGRRQPRRHPALLRCSSTCSLGAPRYALPPGPFLGDLPRASSVSNSAAGRSGTPYSLTCSTLPSGPGESLAREAGALAGRSRRRGSWPRR